MDLIADGFDIDLVQGEAIFQWGGLSNKAFYLSKAQSLRRFPCRLLINACPRFGNPYWLQL